jgi:hypothetical protein
MDPEVALSMVLKEHTDPPVSKANKARCTFWSCPPPYHVGSSSVLRWNNVFDDDSWKSIHCSGSQLKLMERKAFVCPFHILPQLTTSIHKFSFPSKSSFLFRIRLLVLSHFQNCQPYISLPSRH